MSQSEKDRKDESKKEPPEFSAIIPGEPPPSVGEIFGDIDDYQKKIEQEWEEARSAYQEKIKRILDEFTQVSAPTSDPSKEPPPDQNKKENEPIPESPSYKSEPGLSEEARLKILLSRVEKTLRMAEQKTSRFAYRDEKPPLIQIAWQPPMVKFKKYLMRSLLAIGLLAGGGLLFNLITQVSPITALPYAHTAGLFVDTQKIYVVDWFRKALYIHAKKKGLPILAVENIPNGFVTGFALTRKSLWTLDGFNREIIEHALSEDHRALSKVAAPGKKPVGLFWDGMDFWTTDSESKILYHHRGTEVTDIMDQFNLPDVTVTDFYLKEKKLWLLDGRSREILVYRLQEPLKPLARFDLDPFLKGATPTGIDVENKKVWLTTENPAQLLQISRRQLEKSNPDHF